ncbi:hypothetical protein [Paludibaculum fermentans]|uniref:hypothetical protein n=1 Tax=Paludibaculum fermentans TaxID=1473598 RepID=UPI003EBE7423
MRLNIVAMTGGLLTGAALLFAADFWEKKPYTEWTEKEARRVLTDSPWARNANVTFGGGVGDTGEGGMGRPGGGGGMGGPGGGGMGGPGGGGMGGPGGGGMGGPGGGGMGGPGGGGMGGPGGGGMSAVVRWQSSLPVRQAMAQLKSASEPGQAKSAQAALSEPSKNYVIAVDGLPMMGGGMRGGPRPGMEQQRFQAGAQQGGPEGGARRGPDPEQMKARMKAQTQINRKGHDPMHPVDVLMPNGEGPRVVYFLFSKDDPISLDDKEVEFVTSVGPMMVKRKFKLSEMVAGGKLEL